MIKKIFLWFLLIYLLVHFVLSVWIMILQGNVPEDTDRPDRYSANSSMALLFLSKAAKSYAAIT